MKQRNANRRIYFYQRSAEPDAAGEETDTFTLVTTGFFALERATRPVEIVADGTTEPQTQYVLLGRWAQAYEDLQSEYFAVDFSGTPRAYELIGDPVDPDGLRTDIMIYCAHNVNRYIDFSSIPKEF